MLFSLIYSRNNDGSNSSGGAGGVDSEASC